MTQQDYEKLREDIRWKNFAYTLKLNNNFKCSHCGKDCTNEQHKLDAHHEYYLDGVDPWSSKYGNSIKPLCRKCHTEWHEKNKLKFKSSRWALERLKEESQWDKIICNNLNLCTVENKIFNNYTDSEKLKIGQYATKICNYFNIPLVKIPVYFSRKARTLPINQYPFYILKYATKFKVGIK